MLVAQNLHLNVLGVFSMNAKELAAYRGKQISMIPQNPMTAFDSASGLLSVQSDVAIENMMLYTYDGASVWGTTIDSRKQYTTTLPILPGHYILRIKTADGIISKKIYKQ